MLILQCRLFFSSSIWDSIAPPLRDTINKLLGSSRLALLVVNWGFSLIASRGRLFPLEANAHTTDIDSSASWKASVQGRGSLIVGQILHTVLVPKQCGTLALSENILKDKVTAHDLTLLTPSSIRQSPGLLNGYPRWQSKSVTTTQMSSSLSPSKSSTDRSF